MSTASPTIAEIAAHLGVSPDRVLDHPAPGLATVDDVLALNDRDNRLFELIDGVLVEKVVGFRESRLAAVLIHLVENQAGINFPILLSEWRSLTRSHGPPSECRPRRSASTFGQATPLGRGTRSVQDGIPTRSVGTSKIGK
jgi:hypothetical protein